MVQSKRPVSFYLFIAFIASFIVFSSGVGIGLFIDELKSASVSSSITDLQNSIVDAELELLMFDYFGGNVSCNYLILKSEELGEQSSKLGERLDIFERSNQINEEGYLTLKEDYTRVLIKDWLTLEDIKKSCEANYSTILYFYSNTRCFQCENQAYVLNYYKNMLKSNVLIFAIDSDMNISIVKMLVYNYGINTYPSLVVDGVLNTGYQNITILGKTLGVQ
ncbi:Uncharacterised protein [Candidatus Tiddalikarchaeum anstoanum]|nr:Uncharacterised protein [Candidatus Tiddalikarchaeum anstoanum]